MFFKGGRMIRTIDNRRASAALVALVATATLTLDTTAARAATGSTESSSGASELVAERVYGQLSLADDAQAAYAGLAPDDRAAFDAYLLPATATESVVLTPLDADAQAALGDGGMKGQYDSTVEARAQVAAAGGCWGTTAKNTSSAAAGNALYDTWVEGTWCSDGTNVTSATYGRSWTTIAALGWRDEGEVASGAGVSGGQGKIWSQRKLVLGAGGWDVQEQLPCTRLIGNASGSASGDRTCSIYN
jgi:hypothetical protein